MLKHADCKNLWNKYINYGNRTKDILLFQKALDILRQSGRFTEGVFLIGRGRKQAVCSWPLLC